MSGHDARLVGPFLSIASTLVLFTNAARREDIRLTDGRFRRDAMATLDLLHLVSRTKVRF